MKTAKPFLAVDTIDPVDLEARTRNLYGMRILRCAPDRLIEVETPEGPRWVVDCVTNSPFSLNLREEVVSSALEAIKKFGAIHSSVACARAETGLAGEITAHLCSLKGGESLARIYPTTFSANIATAAGLAKMGCTAVVHPHVHATVQFALKGAFESGRIVFTKNTAEVATAFAKTTRRPVVVIEDGLYSMGGFADFEALGDFLKSSPNGMVWLDDAHSVGMRGKHGRGEAMEQMADFTDRCLVTGSFGKALGAAGGFLVGPETFVQQMLGVSVADRFSCNLDIGAQGAVLAAMKLLTQEGELETLQQKLAERLNLLDDALSSAGVLTEQFGTEIAYRVVPFNGPMEGVKAASALLDEAGFLTTPVYYPTIARGTGAIRVSISAAHSIADIERLSAALLTQLRPKKAVPALSILSHTWADASAKVKSL
jgi:8-amino-7-oxononanoate synthase